VALRRRRGDPPPESPRAVLVVALAGVVSPDAARKAIALADGGPIAVLALLRIHGYAFGMPNPGLMPTPKERTAQLDVVSRAIGRIEKLGGEADGQVTATRHPARTVTAVARRRNVHHVVIDQATVSRLRRSIEGDVAAAVRRRLGSAVEVVVTETGEGPARRTAPRSAG
jgi:hypothetical protein